MELSVFMNFWRMFSIGFGYLTGISHAVTIPVLLTRVPPPQAVVLDTRGHVTGGQRHVGPAVTILVPALYYLLIII